MTFSFDLSVDAWIKGIEIEADSEKEAMDELSSMSLSELVENGFVKDFSLSDIDVSVDEDDEDDDFEDDDVDDNF